MLRLSALALLLASVAPAADSTLLNLVMPDARVVSGVNLASTRVSPFGKFVLDAINETPNKDFQNFIDMTGFDPRRDLNEIVFASPATKTARTTLILARGTFDITRLMGMAKMAGVETKTFNGVEMLDLSKKGLPMPLSLAFLDSSTLVAGDVDSVQGAIGRHRGGTGLAGPLATRVTSLSSTQDIWMLSVVPLAEFADQLPKPGKGGAPFNAELVKAINEASLSVKFGEIINLSAEVVADTAENASALGDVLRFLAGMAQMDSSKESEPLRAVLKTMDLKTTGTSTKLVLAVPQAVIDTMKQKSQAAKPPAAAK